MVIYLATGVWGYTNPYPGKGWWSTAFLGKGVQKFNQSEARKQSFLTSDWLEFENFPQKVLYHFKV